MIRPAALMAALAATASSFAITPSFAQDTQTAIFAGGCFWCVESDFDHVDGVTSTVSGYIGGSSENPTYQNHSGHVEAVRVTYDPSKVSYDELLTVFWHSIDPTDGGGQFCDRGHSYTTAIFATDQEQLQKAKATKADVEKQLGSVATEVAMAPTFWEAEGYHQDYYLKNPVKYKFYRTGCGRNKTVERVWGDDAFKGIKDAIG
ncbi:peptide-methionine (S)-S-oxide reductase [Fulvimarina manganoxydans]|uniref:Peptide methionine sulfoxide reductase MsrA n=1 Tax=Fulvimarina manganoxydans TaxID=937218 RepID=A0A1W1Z640_9HYPH|nr:peptide-methionine (S)-S-oxide reductase MsrA [Fulvimarina manganoxydans]SMC43836.1 peptide-methionine (S)-S-oxide reductase [Fulvimarina manganoxydans]